MGFMRRTEERARENVIRCYTELLKVGHPPDTLSNLYRLHNVAWKTAMVTIFRSADGCDRRGRPYLDDLEELRTRLFRLTVEHFGFTEEDLDEWQGAAVKPFLDELFDEVAPMVAEIRRVDAEPAPLLAELEEQRELIEAVLQRIGRGSIWPRHSANAHPVLKALADEFEARLAK